jgi:hypothetical protein
MFVLPFTYAARRRSIERRRRLVHAHPDRAAMPDVVDLLRRTGLTVGEARRIVDRATAERVLPSDLWQRVVESGAGGRGAAAVKRPAPPLHRWAS